MLSKNNKTLRYPCWVWIILLVLSIHSPAAATTENAAEDPDIVYLKGLSIEDLLQTEIPSASKKSEQLFNTASAVFVISNEDIRRTGARSIPEALRMVPGLQVAHIDAHHRINILSGRPYPEPFERILVQSSTFRPTGNRTPISMAISTLPEFWETTRSPRRN